MDPEVILPIYFVADQSSSMEDVIEEVNTGLVKLLHAMQVEPMAADRIRFSVLGFSDDVSSYMEPTDLRTIQFMPMLRTSGRTEFAKVFRYLREHLPSHVSSLRAQGFLITRPSVFFLTDGQPTDDEDTWRSELAALKSEDFSARPNILAFGVGPNAKPRIILDIATNDDFAMLSVRGSDVGESLARFAESLTNSVVASGQALASGSTELPVVKPDGFVLAIDILS
jgi:uncharacterized protein YegL